MLSIAALAVACVLAAAASAGATTGPRWIVFSATPSGQHTDQLFRIQASGEGLQQITTGGYPSIDPAFSPDGKRIAFARTGVGILTMNVDGTGIRRLTKNGRDGFPSWSPDSRQIAFIRPYKAEWTIHTMSSSGAGQRPLPKAPPSGRPSWTAAGLLIPSGGDLLKIDPANGHVLKYYGAQIDAVWGLNSVALSPDRSKIAFVGARTAEPGDKECGEGTVPTVRALQGEHRRQDDRRGIIEHAARRRINRHVHRAARTRHISVGLDREPALARATVDTLSIFSIVCQTPRTGFIVSG